VATSLDAAKQREKMVKKCACDVCGSYNSVPIDCLTAYTGGQEIDVCKECGFVFVSRRRTSKEIADSWSHELFANGESEHRDGEIYTAVRPAIRARLIHILETIDQELGVDGSSICDIGAGEGVFLDYARKLKNPKRVFGIEPSAKNCDLMSQIGIENFAGTIEDYNASSSKEEPFDIAVIQWTLEACADAKAMLKASWDLLKPGGHIVIGTGSRILVPFKKPLQFYISVGEQDTHALRFSPKSIRNILRISGFEPKFMNRYIDNDVMCVVAQKVEEPSTQALEVDDFSEVASFFQRWDKESREHYADWHDD
jgi:2-polyprenyl-3-methyl-5-hydroxy-6-metoxy-1,4-benzoquinol methylase